MYPTSHNGLQSQHSNKKVLSHHLSCS